ncbi:uncharacterized protein SPPG_08860 [Spizellomyces punctatus DAOM BR117]|uniref:DAGKc domain-containing protein n=1 Tax=Spizellomyces punctatus (strain DAOM BR117) TaxID=645134 RepID=A0A0L0HVM0_SPIPD|nr:uncharacterized protein SPPG_08860 [Spizellomyces punctatus DAOM BR117]KND04950.1 hypothetical protein SPPG_08860 [Spizellomyces punctatus DAOM BR117]|eukprot:XP_016612989.1 hypothetical protein SPPG_08860 [Spizellomyces punctatus DAOM BR117]
MPSRGSRRPRECSPTSWQTTVQAPEPGLYYIPSQSWKPIPVTFWLTQEAKDDCGEYYDLLWKRLHSGHKSLFDWRWDKLDGVAIWKVSLKSVFAARLLDGDTKLEIHFLKNIGKFGGSKLDFVTFEGPDIHRLAKQVSEAAELVRFRKLLVIVNPRGLPSGAGVYNDIVGKMLELAEVDIELWVTERPNHAYDFIQQESNISQYTTIITVGGDRIVHEVINALLSRPDWETASKIPLGIIPSGPANALNRSLDTLDPYVATLAAIRGVPQPTDLMAVTTSSGQRVYSHLSFMWGLLADIDLESKWWRWIGSLRFDIFGLWRMVNLRKYQGVLHYLPVDETGPPHLHRGRSLTSPLQARAKFSKERSVRSFSSPPRPRPRPRAPAKYAHLDPSTGLPSGWVTLEAGFTSFTALNHPWISSSLLGCNFTSASDGVIDLVFSQTDRTGFLPLFLEQDKARHMNDKRWHVERVKAFILEPGMNQYGNLGLLDVDGQSIEHGCVWVECLENAIRILVPPDLAVREMERDQKRRQRMKAVQKLERNHMRPWQDIISESELLKLLILLIYDFFIPTAFNIVVCYVFCWCIYHYSLLWAIIRRA